MQSLIKRINSATLFIMLAVLLAGCANPSPVQSTPVPPPATAEIATNAPAPEPTSIPATEITPPTAVIQPTQPTRLVESVRVQFKAGEVMTQIPGSLEPGAVSKYVFGAMKGQIVTVELTVSPETSEIFPAEIAISGADGSPLTKEQTTKWKGTLIASQDYVIELRSNSKEKLTYSLLVAIPAIGSTPYVPVTTGVCQMLQEMAAQALETSFTMETRAPFEDYVTAEKGFGCKLSASGSGTDFSDPMDIIEKLKNGIQGFSELIAYQASGPTGEATALTRDSAVLLLNAEWQPAPGANCPADQPISACDLKPEQKIYTVTIQAAMK